MINNKKKYLIILCVVCISLLRYTNSAPPNEIEGEGQSTKFQTGDYVQNTVNLNMRTGPGLGYSIITTRPQGAKGGLVVADPDNGIFADGYYWWRVQFGSDNGWCVENWLKSIAPYAVGQGAPDPQLFIDCYFRMLFGYAKRDFNLFGYAINAVHRWGNGLIQEFRKDSDELAMMQHDSLKMVYAIYGAIWQKYKSLGNPPDFLGYPTSDEREANRSGAEGFSTQGRVQNFEHGHLHYHRTGSYKHLTFETHGPIDDVYMKEGGSGGWLGFPISDEYKNSIGVSLGKFEGGFITTLNGTDYAAYHSPPTIANSFPASNATDISITTNIEVAFSSPMNKSATEDAFSITPSVSGTKSWKDAFTLIFDPSENLADNTEYTVTISDVAEDLADNPFFTTLFSFTTETGDITPPPAPINLTVTPSDWTNSNLFTIDWTNPDDPSGIDKAYYKLGSLPTHPTDGIYTTSKPFSATATSEGEQVIYVWLTDGAGNVNQNNRSSATLYYDATPPTGTISINSGAEITDSTSVTLTLSATDAYSEMGLGAQMKFSNDNQSWSTPEPYATTKQWTLTEGEGIKTVYVKLKDVAGSWSEEEISDTITLKEVQRPEIITPSLPDRITAPSVTGAPVDIDKDVPSTSFDIPIGEAQAISVTLMELYSASSPSPITRDSETGFSTGVKMQITFPPASDYKYGYIASEGSFYVDIYGVHTDVKRSQNINIIPISKVFAEQYSLSPEVLRISFMLRYFEKPIITSAEGKLLIDFVASSDWDIAQREIPPPEALLGLKISDGLTLFRLRTTKKINPTVMGLSSPQRVVIQLPIANIFAPSVKVSTPHVKGITTKEYGAKDTPSTQVVFYLKSPADFSTTINGRGVDIIFGQPLKSAEKPESHIPNSEEEYIVGKRDVLEVTLWWKEGEEQVSTVTVQDNGMITYSLVGDIMVEGLTPTQIDERITEGLKKYLKDYEVAVIVKEYKSKMVDILGEVQSTLSKESGPGRYPLRGKTYLLDLVISAGGLSPRADPKKVRVIRKTGEVLHVDLEQMLNSGDRSKDVLLKPGDLIYIPTAVTAKVKNVFVTGAVEAPGAQIYTENLTAFEAISMAGGLSKDAANHRVEIIRETGEVLKLDPNAILMEKDRNKDVQLMPNDIVYVTTRKADEIAIFGEISSSAYRRSGAGFYPITEPIRLLDFIISAGGVTPAADTTRVKVVRQTGDIIECDLNEVIFKQDETQNILLQPGDRIFIPPVNSEQNKILVLGAVSKPGVYYAKKGITILDLVSEAGGTAKDANLRNARIIRSGPKSEEIIPVDLHAASKRMDMSENLLLQPNDVVYIPKRSSSILSDLLADFMPLLQLTVFTRMLGK